MGLNIQTEEFWSIRPDNFITMYIGYRKRQQTEAHPIRRLIQSLYAVKGVQLTQKDIQELMPLPLIDVVFKKGKERTVKTNYITPDKKAELEEAHKKRLQYLKDKKQKKKTSGNNT